MMNMLMEWSLCGMAATVITHPLDLLKNRMQLYGTTRATSAKSLISSILSEEGPTGLYHGLPASLASEVISRIVEIDKFTLIYYFTPEDEFPSLKTFLGAGLACACLSAFVRTPIKTVMSRITVDKALPPNERRNYKNLIDAIIRISREEGIATLWRGVAPTFGSGLISHLVVTVMISDNVQRLVWSSEQSNRWYWFLLFGGIVATTAACMPLDVCRTRMQITRAVTTNNDLEETRSTMCRIARNEGLSALWTGFLPYGLHLGLHMYIRYYLLAFYKLASYDKIWFWQGSH